MKFEKVFKIVTIIACIVAFFLGMTIRFYTHTMEKRKAHTIYVTGVVEQTIEPVYDDTWDGTRIIKIDGHPIDENETVVVIKH